VKEGEYAFMPAILRVKPEEIDTVEKRGRFTVGVIGCGQKGILYAMAFADAGFKVKCVDADQSVVKRVTKGKNLFSERDMENKLKSYVRTGQILATNDFKSAVSQSDIIVLTATAKIDSKKNPDYSEVESNCKQIGSSLRRDTLFIYCGTSGFGFTESVIKETLENASGLKTGEGFGIVYNPLQISDGQTIPLIANRELRIAGFDKTSLDAASTVLGWLTKNGVRTILDVKAMELAVLFAATKKEVENALANELAVLCESAGTDYFKILKLLTSNERMPPPTITEEEGENETYLLLENAENLNTKLRLSKLAKQTNEEAVWHAINLTQNTLRSCGKTFRRSRIAVVGSAKTGTATVIFVKMLEAKGAKVSLYDPFLAKTEPTDAMFSLKRSLDEAVEGTDCIVLFVGQDQYKRLNFKKLRTIMRTPAAIVDLIGLDSPQEVEKEGFTYRGFGRGFIQK
jgi:UDP-N-acetyl-D-mannosaminuronic acid dehydrogenase